MICFSIELEEREEQGFLAGLKIPCPWATGKSIESIHPVRDNYKYKETVHIPGARCLFLRFDPRCSSQYDYDKVNDIHLFHLKNNGGVLQEKKIGGRDGVENLK